MVASLASDRDNFHRHCLLVQDRCASRKIPALNGPHKPRSDESIPERRFIHGRSAINGMTARAAAGSDNVLQNLGKPFRVGPRR